MERSQSFDYFVECFVISPILEEDPAKIFNFKENRILDDEDIKIGCQNYLTDNKKTVADFFGIQTDVDCFLTPDILIQLKNQKIDIVIDVYNGEQKKL